MNTIIESLMERKSVRVFTDKEILAEEKEQILLAAMAAPTAGNQQMYTILDITDQKLKETLSETCDHQPFIAKAPLVLVFCADVQKWYDMFVATDCEPRKPMAGDLMLAVQDTVIAAQNAVTAAWSLGIGSCYIGDIMEQCEVHRELLHLPDYVFPATMVVFGYPTKQQENRRKPERCRLSDMVQENHYKSRSQEELCRMFDKEYPEGGFHNWAAAFCKRKYNSEFSKEMSRSVEQYLKKFK